MSAPPGPAGWTDRQLAEATWEQNERLQAGLIELVRLLGEHPLPEVVPVPVAVSKPGYDFKKLQELGWALAALLAPVLAGALRDFATVTDWRAWALGLVSASVRLIGGYIIGKISERAAKAAEAEAAAHRPIPEDDVIPMRRVP